MAILLISWACASTAFCLAFLSAAARQRAHAREVAPRRLERSRERLEEERIAEIEDLAHAPVRRFGPLVFTGALLDHLLDLMGEKHPIHDDAEFKGPTGIQYGEFKGEVPKGPVVLQGDHDTVRFRNVWIVPAKY